MVEALNDERVERVLALVGAFEPADAKAAESKARMLHDIPAMASPLDESADPVHITSSAVLTSDAGVVLHRHKRLGIWVGPGGHIENSEGPAEAALREALEETGLAARHPDGGPVLIHVDVHPGAKGHTHFDLRWLLVSDSVQPQPAEGESTDIGWFSFEQAAEMVPEDYRQALRSAQGFQRLR